MPNPWPGVAPGASNQVGSPDGVWRRLARKHRTQPTSHRGPTSGLLQPAHSHPPQIQQASLVCRPSPRPKACEKVFRCSSNSATHCPVAVQELEKQGVHHTPPLQHSHGLPSCVGMKGSCSNDSQGVVACSQPPLGALWTLCAKCTQHAGQVFWDLIPDWLQRAQHP
jgi:hypothetical protein